MAVLFTKFEITLKLRSFFGYLIIETTSKDHLVTIVSSTKHITDELVSDGSAALIFTSIPPAMDHYSVLEVAADATQDEIRRSYKRLVLIVSCSLCKG